MSPHENDRTLDELESQLAALRPASRLDRDALLFAAGRASSVEPRRPAARAMRWLSPMVSVASILLAATFAALWWNEVRRPAPQMADPSPPAAPVPLAVDDGDDASPALLTTSKESYFHLRHVALSEGIDAWPERLPAGGQTPVPTVRSQLPLGES